MRIRIHSPVQYKKSGSGSKLGQNLGSGSKLNVFGYTTLVFWFIIVFFCQEKAKKSGLSSAELSAEVGKIRAHIGQLGRVVGQLEVTPLQRDARVTEELGRLICLRYRGLDAWSFHLVASRAGPSQLELEISCTDRPVFGVEPLAPKLLQVWFENSPYYSRFWYRYI